jgi:hypothetical protein
MATKNATYGLSSVKFQNAVANAFPSKWDDATVYSAVALVKDQFNFNDAAPSETNIEVEDMDEYYATLESDKGSKGFTLQVYDLSEAAYTYLMGYKKNETTGFLEEVPGFKLENQAVQVITKNLGSEFKAKQYEWANMKTTVIHAGTIGKSGFPNLTITCTKQALLDASGTEIAGARWKFVE